MERMSKLLLLMVLLSFSTLAGLQAANTEESDKSLIKYRKNLMKSIGADFGSVFLIAKGKVPFKENALQHAQALERNAELLAKMLPEIFIKGSTVPGEFAVKDKSEAKPAIWQDWPDFSKKTHALPKAVKNLVEAAKSNDLEQLFAGFRQVGKVCGSCHKVYRKKSEK